MSVLSSMTIVAAATSAGIILLYWLKRPSLNLRWRFLLFVGIAILPTIAAGTSTVASLEKTTQKQFCGSCHVMQAHYQDASDPSSESLAARHAQNSHFGGNSCYKCHANYGMYGYPLTKVEGSLHVWHYYFGGYNALTLEEAVEKIHINKPYPNKNCTHCHSGQGKGWNAVPDHRSADEALAAGRVSCSSGGCHGAAHPFSKEAKRAALSAAQMQKAEKNE